MYAILLRFAFPFGVLEGYVCFDQGRMPKLDIVGKHRASQFTSKDSAEDMAVYALGVMSDHCLTLQCVLDYEIVRLEKH